MLVFIIATIEEVGEMSKRRHVISRKSLPFTKLTEEETGEKKVLFPEEQYLWEEFMRGEKAY